MLTGGLVVLFLGSWYALGDLLHALLVLATAFCIIATAKPQAEGPPIFGVVIIGIAILFITVLWYRAHYVAVPGSAGVLLNNLGYERESEMLFEGARFIAICSIPIAGYGLGMLIERYVVRRFRRHLAC